MVDMSSCFDGSHVLMHDRTSFHRWPLHCLACVFLCLWTLYWNLTQLYSSTLDYVWQPQSGLSSGGGIAQLWEGGCWPAWLVILRPCLGSLLSHCSLCVCFRFPWVQVCLKCVSTPLILTYVRSWRIFKPLSRVWLTVSTTPVTTSNCRKISASLHRKVNKTFMPVFPAQQVTKYASYLKLLQRKHVFYVFLLEWSNLMSRFF